MQTHHGSMEQGYPSCAALTLTGSMIRASALSDPPRDYRSARKIMAQVEDIIQYLDSDLRRALEDAVSSEIPGQSRQSLTISSFVLMLCLRCERNGDILSGSTRDFGLMPAPDFLEQGERRNEERLAGVRASTGHSSPGGRPQWLL